MSSRRLERLNSQMQREIIQILRLQVRDPRVDGVTVTQVRVTSDLWLARVFVRLPGDSDQKRECLHGLESVAGFVRRALGEILRIRRIPEIRFIEDETAEQARRIDELLLEIRPSLAEPTGDEEE